MALQITSYLAGFISSAALFIFKDWYLNRQSLKLKLIKVSHPEEETPYWLSEEAKNAPSCFSGFKWSIINNSRKPINIESVLITNTRSTMSVLCQESFIIKPEDAQSGTIPVEHLDEFFDIERGKFYLKVRLKSGKVFQSKRVRI